MPSNTKTSKKGYEELFTEIIPGFLIGVIINVFKWVLAGYLLHVGWNLI